MSIVRNIIRLGGIEEAKIRSVPFSGSYALVIKVSQKIKLKSEKHWVLEPGKYLYIGRASRNLKARIERHRKRTKKNHWHIDYITTNVSAIIKNVLIFPDKSEKECSIVQELIKSSDLSVPILGFGNSDCIRGCPAHLIMAKTTLKTDCEEG